MAGLKWQAEQAARSLEAEKRRGEALARERESLAKLRAQAETATHTQACPLKSGWRPPHCDKPSCGWNMLRLKVARCWG